MKTTANPTNSLFFLSGGRSAHEARWSVRSATGGLLGCISGNTIRIMTSDLNRFKLAVSA